MCLKNFVSHFSWSYCNLPVEILINPKFVFQQETKKLFLENIHWCLDNLLKKNSTQTSSTLPSPNVWNEFWNIFLSQFSALKISLNRFLRLVFRKNKLTVCQFQKISQWLRDNFKKTFLASKSLHRRISMSLNRHLFSGKPNPCSQKSEKSVKLKTFLTFFDYKILLGMFFRLLKFNVLFL